ncbi:MAG: PCYCGC domain-containing protein [Candidatus Obscuribacterales bacterium]|nr:PCYCGC domain-containing protein [Candidatus Obscuribacterales bacterium]
MNSRFAKILPLTLAFAFLSGQVNAQPPKTATVQANAGETYHVLPAEQFFGAAQMGYTAAKLAPEIISKLFCYCGCDITDGHGRLLDCFEGYHGVDCHICVEEAMQALTMKREGKSLGEIQQKVDQMFSDKYPFQQETDKLKKYKASRQYKADLSSEAKAAADREKDPNRRPLILNKKPEPGEPGGCCANHDDKNKTKKK